MGRRSRTGELTPERSDAPWADRGFAMQCPECNTPNRDDTAFCGMCKKLFRTAPHRSSRPPPPSPTPVGGFWHALLERLSGAPSPPMPPVDGSTLEEVAAALQAACPALWRSAELRISVAEPARSIVSRGDDPHERIELTPRLQDALREFARGHSVAVQAGRAYLVVVERQPDGQWTMRCAVDAAHPA